MPKEAFDHMISPQGTFFAGSPQQVIDKIMFTKDVMGAVRYAGQIDIGGQPFSQVMKGIELFASKVAPVLRKS